MITTSTTTSDLDRPDRRPFRLATVAGRIGAIFVAAILGIVHAIVEHDDFAQLGFGPWGDYLIFGLGLTVVAFLIAYGAWRISASRRPRWPTLVLVGLGAFGLMLQLIGIAVFEPALLVRPLGPGLWSLVCAPALLIEVVALIVRWSARGRQAGARHPDR